VLTIRWLLARQAEGLRISQAIALWKRLEQEGTDPLTTPPYAVPSATISMQGAAEVDALRQAWIDACERFDENMAESILAQAFALYPPETVTTHVLMKGMAEIGEGWYEGLLTIQQEHFASELAVRRVETLLASVSQARLPGRLLVICPPGEAHTFSPLLLTYYLRRRGREATFLGANVPILRLEETLRTSLPRMVILSAQQLVTAASSMQMAEYLRERGIQTAFGGRIFNLVPEIRARIPAFPLGSELHLAPDEIERLLQGDWPELALSAPDTRSAPALASFDLKLPDIEQLLWENFSPPDFPTEYLEIANDNLAKNIRAALTLGDIRLISRDMDWVHGLLQTRRMPDQILGRYLETYARTVAEVLGDPGGYIAGHLFEIIANKLAQP
jgi:methanogenic corrinoid protein MtbC1